MDIDEFKEEKKNLEQHIARVVVDAISVFRENTGYSPSSINVNLCEVTTLSDLNKKYEVFDCKVDIDL